MEPLNINKQGCTEQSSNCIVWQGPTLECIGLCHGASITQAIYEMATKICSILEELSVDNYDITCLNSTICSPETFTELIQLLIQSICDINVEAGANGLNGNYTEVEAFAPGENGCENGGIAITTFDGVTSTQINQFFICNPINGEDGATGPQGPRGDYVQIVAASLGQCPTGGIVIQVIDGITSGILSEDIICNGTNGTNGTDGNDGINGNYVETRIATLGECSEGGVVVTLKDGITNLTISEDIICNGVNGVTGAVCEYGMFYGLTTGTGNGGPTDYAATIAVKTSAGTGRVPFPQDGPTTGIARIDSTSFTLPNVGTYEVYFNVHTTEPGQLQIELDGAALPETTIASMNPTSGGHNISGSFLITTATTNSVLAVINPAGNSTALTITPADGANTHANAQVLVVKELCGVATPECNCVECIDTVTYVLDSEYPSSIYTPPLEDCFVLVQTILDDTFVVNLDNEVEGKKYTVKNMHSSVYSISVGSTLYDIDGASSFSLLADKSATFIFAQGEWRILSTNFNY